MGERREWKKGREKWKNEGRKKEKINAGIRENEFSMKGAITHWLPGGEISSAVMNSKVRGQDEFEHFSCSSKEIEQECW